MWYHYLALLVGLYLVATSLYHLIMFRGVTGYVMNGISLAIGVALAYYGYAGVTAPVVPPPIFSGGRKLWRY
jgi:hypothetical protein